MTSCTKIIYISHVSKQEETHGVLFEKYSDSGFLFTSETYNGTYDDSRGIVSYEIYEGCEFTTKKSTNKNSNAAYGIIEISRFGVDFSEGVDSLYHIATRIKADAIINFTIETISKTYNTVKDLDHNCTLRSYEGESKIKNNIVPLKEILTHPNMFTLKQSVTVYGVKISGLAIKRK